MLQVGVSCAPDGSCLLHGRADGREGGNEMIKDVGERDAHVTDWGGDDLYPSLLFLENCDEGGVLSCFFPIFLSQPKSM